MKAHTITLEPYDDQPFSTKLAINMATIALTSLSKDERLTVLLTLLEQALPDVVDDREQLDAVIEAIGLRLKMKVDLGTSG